MSLKIHPQLAYALTNVIRTGLPEGERGTVGRNRGELLRVWILRHLNDLYCMFTNLISGAILELFHHQIVFNMCGSVHEQHIQLLCHYLTKVASFHDVLFMDHIHILVKGLCVWCPPVYSEFTGLLCFNIELLCD